MALDLQHNLDFCEGPPYRAHLSRKQESLQNEQFLQIAQMNLKLSRANVYVCPLQSEKATTLGQVAREY